MHQVHQLRHVRLIPLDGCNVSQPATPLVLGAFLTWNVKRALTSPLPVPFSTWNVALAGRPMKAQATHQAHQLRHPFVIRLDGHSISWTGASSALVACFTGTATLAGRPVGAQATYQANQWRHLLLVHLDDHSVF